MIWGEIMQPFFQDSFTESSRIYLSLEDEIREMIRFKNDNKVDKNEVLKSFDLLVQLVLLNLCALDDKVCVQELEFIKKLTVEEDILDYVNKVSTNKIEWEKISSTVLTNNQFNDFLDYVCNVSSSKINSFVMLLASIDALTEKNYLYRFKQGFKELAMCFVSANNEKEYNYEIDNILNKAFVLKYKSLKTIFSLGKYEDIK